MLLNFLKSIIYDEFPSNFSLDQKLDQIASSINTAPFFIDEVRLPIKPPSPMLKGLEEYKFNKVLKELVFLLYKKNPVFRAVRGDGNCFYRSVGFLILEHGLLEEIEEKEENQGEKQRMNILIDILEEIQKNKAFFEVCKILPEKIRKLGDIRENFLIKMLFLLELRHSKATHKKSLLPVLSSLERLMNTDELFDTAVVLLARRLCAIGVERMEDHSLKEIFKKEINEISLFGHEAEQIVINKLAEFLKIKITINYIDRKQIKNERPRLITDVHGKENAKLELQLYFRPGL